MEPEVLLTLPRDLVIQPIAELARDLRERLAAEEGDVALTRAGTRSSSVVVDAPTADLLELFREPRTLTDAVLLYSLPRRLDSRKILGSAFPMIRRFFKQGLVVDSEVPHDQDAPEAAWQPGEVITPWGLVVSQLVHLQQDVELYKVWQRVEGRKIFGALKLARESPRRGVGSLTTEAEFLRTLAGRGAPRLLRQGMLGGQTCLLLDWCSGVGVEAAAREWRKDPLPEGRRALLHLACAIARSYARLHERGILHGDVHPGNLLVDGNGRVTLLDFAAGRRIDDPRPAQQRPGVALYFEPELARSMLAGNGFLSPSPAGEQYAVAALIYALVTGSPTHDFRLERRAMYHQLANEPHLGFETRGAPRWPELEAILSRALEKIPEERYPTCGDFAAALEDLSPGRTAPRTRPRPAAELQRRADDLLKRLIAGLPQPASPSASVVHGLAGGAAALVGLAGRREDPRLLATADHLACRALRESTSTTGFVAEEIGLPRNVIGHISPFYCEPGPWAVQAMVARAQGSLAAGHPALLAFAERAAAPEGGPEGPAGLDLILGHAGGLLFSALLADGISAAGVPAELEDLARHQQEVLTPHLEAAAPISPKDNLGMAHGWAGLLYAHLQWARASGQDPSPAVLHRLEELSHLAEPDGRGRRWLWSTPSGAQAGAMPGWCNGSAGFVFLWSLAWRLLADKRYRALAEAAAWSTWESRETAASLCCGLVSRSYALLNLYRHTGVESWWRRACELANQALFEDSFSASFPNSLYKGELSLALLAEDLANPEDAAMPFFEEEGWPAPGSLTAR